MHEVVCSLGLQVMSVVSQQHAIAHVHVISQQNMWGESTCIKLFDMHMYTYTHAYILVLGPLHTTTQVLSIASTLCSSPKQAATRCASIRWQESQGGSFSGSGLEGRKERRGTLHEQENYCSLSYSTQQLDTFPVLYVHVYYTCTYNYYIIIIVMM